MPRTAPVSTSTLATPMCRFLSPNSLPSGRTSATPSSAASIAFLVNVVVMRRPPPSISSAVNGSPSSFLVSVRSSFFTIVSTWPFWPPYLSSALRTSNFGSLRCGLLRLVAR